MKNLFQWFKTRIVYRVIGDQIGGLYPADEETAAKIKTMIDAAKDARIAPIKTEIGTFYAFMIKRLK